MNLKKMFKDEPIFFLLMTSSAVMAILMPDLYARICFLIVTVLYYRNFI